MIIVVLTVLVAASAQVGQDPVGVFVHSQGSTGSRVTAFQGRSTVVLDPGSKISKGAQLTLPAGMTAWFVDIKSKTYFRLKGPLNKFKYTPSHGVDIGETDPDTLVKLFQGRTRGSSDLCNVHVDYKISGAVVISWEVKTSVTEASVLVAEGDKIDGNPLAFSSEGLASEARSIMIPENELTPGKRYACRVSASMSTFRDFPLRVPAPSLWDVIDKKRNATSGLLEVAGWFLDKDMVNEARDTILKMPNAQQNPGIVDILNQLNKQLGYALVKL